MKIQKPLILGNWKMHFDKNEVRAFFKNFLDENITKLSKERSLGFAVPFPYLDLSSEILKDSGVLLGAQNVHWEQYGAFTGEISATMLKNVNTNFVLTGHSERRTLFGDTNESVSKRTKAAVSKGLIAIVCVGETKEEYQSGKREEVLREQIPASLAHLKDNDFENIVIAYEPVWAIGTGLSASPEEAESAHKLIREILKTILDGNKNTNLQASEIPLIYGGSVKEETAKALIEQPNIDGFLVGGASLKADSFKVICSA